jgi:hypothetical protein
MSNKDSYENRLKKMKKSIQDNKEILEEEFPDDVSYSGNPDLLKKEDDEIEEANKKDTSSD